MRWSNVRRKRRPLLPVPRSAVAAIIVGSLVFAASAVWMCVPGPALAEAAKPSVIASIKPVHSLVARIMEGVGTPALLVKGTASPHTFAMKPSDARALNSARIVFRVSEQVEPFTRRIVESLPKTVTVVTLAEATGVQLLDKRAGDAFEPHHHDAGDHDDDDHDDHHGENGAKDGHVWLDPRNAKAMVAAIADALVPVFPKQAAKLKENAARLTSDLDRLEAEIATELAPDKGRPFVVFHDAYQYFERRFGLNAIGSITVSPEVQPSAHRLTQIREKISALHAACVFAEPQFSTNLVASVTEGTGARSGTLDPEGTSVAEGASAYFDIMRALSSGLKACLHQGS